MSVATEASPCRPPEAAEITQYRSISRAAIMSLVLGFASIGGLGFSSLLILPVVGLVLGLVALSTIRRYPMEYTGGRIAATGIVLCTLLFVVGASWHTYDYLTEVPPGYIRTGFWELQPDVDRPELTVSPKSLELSGKSVFIKGYVHPGVASRGKVDRFILVPDMGTCCFGGDPKATDMIEVFVPDPANRLAYSRKRVKLAGKFEVSNESSQRMQMKNPVWYHLELREVR
jgi:Domain of unknown function (DUF4190)/Protein of unknown function (DUF3299)